MSKWAQGMRQESDSVRGREQADGGARTPFCQREGDSHKHSILLWQGETDSPGMNSPWYPALSEQRTPKKKNINFPVFSSLFLQLPAISSPLEPVLVLRNWISWRGVNTNTERNSFALFISATMHSTVQYQRLMDVWNFSWYLALVLVPLVSLSLPVMNRQGITEDEREVASARERCRALNTLTTKSHHSKQQPEDLKKNFGVSWFLCFMKVQCSRVIWSLNGERSLRGHVYYFGTLRWIVQKKNML